ncbi:Myosin-6 [Vitis vinifera]|uniref:Myosin-6 n=1 Tax=Vitis vinifera TaxID=29760 RepID=A0A438DTV6_VITVI|nr:Myosin-6 [Vitis vinifera]
MGFEFPTSCSEADIEEAKTQENAKLQNALQDMQVQFQETKEMLIKERENAKKADEKVPIIQEVPAIDHEMMNKLTAENEKLKDLVSSLEKKIDETQRKYEETNKISEERLKQALDAESKIIQLKTDMQRLEEKLSDMETEDQILRQQVSLHSPVGKMSEHLAIASEPHLENGHHGTEEKKTSEPESATPVKKFGTESDNKLRKSQIERQHESVDSLIKCVSQDLGFSNGKPVAAVTIYKCLLHWKSFEAEKTSVFDRLIQMIGSAFENQDNNEHMAYWLSNTSTLLLLLQRSLRTTGAASLQQKPPPAPSLFGRMAQGFRSSFSSANVSVDVVRQVEAKYPALLFKQQLTAYVETIYGIIRDNLKKDLSSVLSSCIQD